MKRASAPGYDLFKTIVTVILLAILLLMLLRGCATNVVPRAPAETTTSPNATEKLPSSPVQTQTNPASEATETLVPSLVPSTVEPTTSPSSTLTSAATEAATTDASTPTPALAETEQPPTTVPDAATPTPAENVSCNTSMPSRLAVGQTARVVQRLNMRNDASIDATLIQTNPTNTQVEIIGGPVCTPVGDRAYLWWQIRLANGAEGWSAESPLNDATYFLEPIP